MTTEGQQRFRLRQNTRTYGESEYIAVRAYLHGRLVGYALCENEGEVEAARREFTEDFDR